MTELWQWVLAIVAATVVGAIVTVALAVWAVPF